MENILFSWGIPAGNSKNLRHDDASQSPPDNMPLNTFRIALIHATALAIAPVNLAFARHWPQAQLQNILDDSLSRDHAMAGHLTAVMVQRFVNLALYAKGSGCHAILFTCSAFGQAIEAAGAAADIQTLKPNEAMFEQALTTPSGSRSLRVGLVASFEPSIASMQQEFEALAQTKGRSIEFHGLFVPQAMNDLAQGLELAHHQRIAQGVSQLPPCDVIMLAQFSMAVAQTLVQQQTQVPVLTSPDCAVLTLKQRMEHV
jgi:hypothetical protein